LDASCTTAFQIFRFFSSLLDCFVGSGTTAAVAEKLNRRWIACDLSRFAIHTTRKRLLGIPSAKPFSIQNLGKYERQAWQVAEFPANGKDHLEEQRKREVAYRQFILDLYRAKARLSRLQSPHYKRRLDLKFKEALWR
jgi:DNA methylase